MKFLIIRNQLVTKAQRIFSGLSLVLCCAALFLCAPAAQAKDKAALAAKGDKLYTKFSLFYEEKVHRTTNYRIGVLVPINTEVTFVKSNGKEIYVKLPDGTELKIENIENFSGEKIDGIFSRTFSKEKVDLSKFSKIEKENIEIGDVQPDMSKDAVIAALGYPPKHQTPSLTSNAWRYWRNRFKTFIVHFKDEKVASIQN